MDFVTFTVIVDDIVYPDGHTAMACLGGGGTQTAFGMKLWASDEERVGLAGRIGTDFPPSCQTWLQEMGIDVSGLLLWSYPTLRAWQVLEEDGRRGQVRKSPVHKMGTSDGKLEDCVSLWRVDLGEEGWGMLRPSIKDVPLDYRNARAYHACVHPSGLDVAFIRELRSSGAKVVSIEPYTHALEIITRTELQALVSGGQIFSPNEKEAVSLVGPGPPLDLIDRLVEAGAEVVSLRRGPLGSIVHRADTGETWDVPAFHMVFMAWLEILADKDVQQPSHIPQGDACGVIGVVDPTGCGNSFCGGFLAGWVKTNDLLTAALWGSISASFMLEHEGVPPPHLSSLRPQAIARLELLRPHAKQLR